jgi:hypothetical protein
MFLAFTRGFLMVTPHPCRSRCPTWYARGATSANAFGEGDCARRDPVDVRFRPYFLNPWVPREGISREQYLITKFGSVERYNANSQRVIDAAAHAGLVYARDKIERQPNTLDCHRLIRWAGDDAAPMKQRLMELYFSEGGDLTEPRRVGAGRHRLRPRWRRGTAEACDRGGCCRG